MSDYSILHLTPAVSVISHLIFRVWLSHAACYSQPLDHKYQSAAVFNSYTGDLFGIHSCKNDPHPTWKKKRNMPVYQSNCLHLCVILFSACALFCSVSMHAFVWLQVNRDTKIVSRPNSIYAANDRSRTSSLANIFSSRRASQPIVPGAHLKPRGSIVPNLPPQVWYFARIAFPQRSATYTGVYYWDVVTIFLCLRMFLLCYYLCTNFIAAAIWSNVCLCSVLMSPCELQCAVF